MPFDFNDLNRFAEETAPSSESQYADSHSYPQDAEDHIPPNATVYQTTGPNAYTKAIEASDGSGPAVNPRSCVTCRRRKVKCDKQMPCTTCRRALIPCIFPAPGRKPRQPRPRDPNAPQKNFSKREAEMVKRLKKLEGIVEELSGQIDVDASKSNSPESGQAPFGPPKRATSHNSTRQTSMAARDGPVSPHASVGSRDGDSISDANEAVRREKTRAQFGRMILNDHKGKTRYVSSAFWSKMNDELDSLRKEATMLSDEDSEDSEYDDTPETTPVHNQTTHDHHAFLLGYRSADVDLRKLYPVPSHIWFLWKIYQDMVEPLIKVVHVPTTDTLLREASRDLDSLSPGDQALVFAIFFAAVVATEPEDAERNFNKSKEDLVAQYRFSAEQALAKADFLTTTDFAVIQALVIFLIVARRFDTSRFCWAMTGLLVRLANGMGLHRDGSLFDMTPFEIEMRRRVWWSIVKVDLRSSEELGMELTIQDRTFDTEVPLNINDADMSPEGTTPLVAKSGPTDMSVHLLRCEITKIARRVIGTVAAGCLAPPTDGGEALAATLEDLEGSLISTHFAHMQEIIRQHTSGDDADDAMSWMVRIITRIVMAKMSLTIYQPILFTEPDKLRPEIRQRIYVSALEILESDTRLHRDARKHPFRWLFMTYSTWQPLAYVLIESARRSWTPLTERAWEAVCGFQRIPLEKTKNADQAAVFLPLRKLFLCVRRHRAIELARLRKDLGEAKRLVQEEETNMTAPWFGQFRETQDGMAQAREKWWRLLKPGDNASLPAPLARPDQFFASPQQQPAAELRGSPPSVASGTGQRDIVSMSDAQMQFMNQFMSQPASSVADLYALDAPGFMGVVMSDIGGSGPGGMDSQSMSFPGPAAPSSGSSTAVPGASVATTSIGTESMFSEQISPHQIMQANDQLPSFMWGNWFNESAAGGTGQGGVQDKSMDDTIAPEDLNMLDQDFDWQDWTQTLKGVDMWQGEAPGAR